MSLTGTSEERHRAGGTTDLFAGSGEMAALMKATDWSQTAVGPVETWPQSLRVVIRSRDHGETGRP